MAIVIANGNKAYLGDLLRFSLNTDQPCHIRLFKNNFTPTGASVAADFTEADFDGYASQTVVAWGAGFLNGSNQGEIDHAIKTWTATGGATPNTIYGYYLTRDSDGKVYYSERNPAGGVLINGAGQTYSVVPRLVIDTLS